jgi:hypothetical protein
MFFNKFTIIEGRIFGQCRQRVLGAEAKRLRETTPNFAQTHLSRIFVPRSVFCRPPKRAVSVYLHGRRHLAR